MDLSFFRGETVVILRKNYTTTSYDRYGSPSSTVEEIELEAVVGITATRLEKDFSNIQSSTTITVFFNAGTEIFPDDQFLVRGTVWEKDGSALGDDIVFNTSLFSPPVKVILKQVKGWVGQQPNTDEALQNIEGGGS